MSKGIAILGAGWLGEPLAYRLRDAGYAVKVSTTRPEKADRLRQAGLDTYVVDLAAPAAPPTAFFTADILIITVPPGGRRDPEVEKSYPRKIARALQAARAGGVERVLFTSSTSVYGEQEGWTAEDVPPAPATASGRALVAVEETLREAYAEQVTILRLAGLVGDERRPGRWFAGKTEVPGGEQFVNLVHRADVLAIIERVIRNNHWGYVLNVCADRHPTKAEFYPAATKALGLTPPTFITAHGPRGKRVDNRRGKKILNYTYRYADPSRFPNGV